MNFEFFLEALGFCFNGGFREKARVIGETEVLVLQSVAFDVPFGLHGLFSPEASTPNPSRTNHLLLQILQFNRVRTVNERFDQREGQEALQHLRVDGEGAAEPLGGAAAVPISIEAKTLEIDGSRSSNLLDLEQLHASIARNGGPNRRLPHELKRNSEDL